MKRISMFSLTFGMVLGFAATGTFAAQPSEVELMKQATVTKGKAEQIALAKVSHGIAKSAEIEKEKGRIVWSFDIARPGTHDITEILVDAKTGKIISTQTESPRDQAKRGRCRQKTLNSKSETLKTAAALRFFVKRYPNRRTLNEIGRPITTMWNRGTAAFAKCFRLGSCG